MDAETLITLTSDIASAHVSNNNISAADVPTLIRTVFDALTAASNPPAFVEQTREPAVSIRSSVKQNSITCLECGQRMKMLKRHLSTDHGLTPDQYRARWNLNADYPMVSPEYANLRRELAVSIGLGRKAKPQAQPEPKKRASRKPKSPAEVAAAD